MERSRSPRRSLQCFVDAHLSSLHQRDRRALQHLRSQIQLVNQWRQVGVLAEAWELLKEQVLSLTVDHPDTLNFRGTFQCLASDMSAIFDNATGQAHDAELALEYLISKLSDTCADQRITSHQQHPNPILALQPGGQTRFRTSTELQCSQGSTLTLEPDCHMIESSTLESASQKQESLNSVSAGPGEEAAAIQGPPPQGDDPYAEGNEAAASQGDLWSNTAPSTPTPWT